MNDHQWSFNFSWFFHEGLWIFGKVDEMSQGEDDSDREFDGLGPPAGHILSHRHLGCNKQKWHRAQQWTIVFQSFGLSRFYFSSFSIQLQALPGVVCMLFRWLKQAVGFWGNWWAIFFGDLDESISPGAVVCVGPLLTSTFHRTGSWVVEGWSGQGRPLVLGKCQELPFFLEMDMVKCGEDIEKSEGVS